MSESEHVIDLVALSESGRVQDEKLLSHIKKAVRLNSIRADLLISKNMCDIARDLLAKGQGDRPDVSHIVLSQYLSAIIYYVRSTKSSSKHRSPFDIRAKLSSDQTRVHKHLCKLRDDVFAHAGPGDAADPWIKTWLVIASAPEGGKLMSASKSRFPTRNDFEELNSHLEACYALMAKASEDAISKVTLSINEASKNNPEFVKMVEQFSVDAEELFGKTAEALMSGERSGAHVIID